MCKFSNKVTAWGCKHEEQARQKYASIQKGKHNGFSVKECGFFINPKYPHMGASPDGIVKCQCCSGKGALEIKCPFCIKHDAAYKALCLEKMDNGLYLLKKGHSYYYQVQLQIYLANCDYADFVVWTESGDPHIERIFPDGDFFKEKSEKATVFYKAAVLPELLAKWFVRSRPIPNNPALECAICYCGESNIESPVLLCSSELCKIKSFHMKCLGYKRKPPANKPWKCIECKQIEKQSKSVNN